MKRKKILQIADERIKRIAGFLEEAKLEKKGIEKLFNSLDNLLHTEESIQIRILDYEGAGQGLFLQIEILLDDQWCSFIEIDGLAYKEANGVPLENYRNPFLLLDENKVQFESEDAVYYTKLWLKDVYPELLENREVILNETS